MNLPQIPENPTLPQLQTYLADLAKARGWESATDAETFLLFTEEVGELAKAIRNRRKIFTETGKSFDPKELSFELADILSYLLELANRFEVNLEEAFREKEEVNSQRNWESNS